MDIAGVISLLQVVVTNLPGAIKTTADLVDLGTKFYATINGTQPTAAEVAQLRSSVDADVILALTLLPAAQPGDPDFVG